MDTGLGSKAYSIIEQGKIGQILSSKPADRRALIEEAAGITKYKARRRQTQLKLEAAQQNLLRVNDIVHEVEKQLESLKRQAGKARRYRVMREEMQASSACSSAGGFVDLHGAGALAVRADGGRGRARAGRRHRARVRGSADGGAPQRPLRGRGARCRTCARSLAELTLAVDRHQGRSAYCREQIGGDGGARRPGPARGGGADGARGPAGRGARRAPGRRGAPARRAGRDEDERPQSAEAAVREAAARARPPRRRAQEQAREGQVGLLGRIATPAERARVRGRHGRRAPPRTC